MTANGAKHRMRVNWYFIYVSWQKVPSVANHSDELPTYQ
ncbi:hypothetical protein [Synechococcus phage S-8S55]|nr:hypothetical protein [Synechococcus phage S-8S55]